MSFDTKIAVFNPGDPGADDKQLYLLRAPSDAQGGGVRILAAYAINGAATSGGTTFTLALHKYANVSAGGTPTVNGTIAAAIGGTTDYWADNVMKAFTLDSDYTFLDAGEFLVAQYNEVSAGNPSNCSIMVHYLLGK